MLLSAKLLLTIAALGTGAIAAEKSDNDRSESIEIVAFETDIDFGKMAMLGHQGRVVIKPNGTRILSGGLENLGGTYGPAVFDLSGQPGQVFAILQHGPVLLRRENGQGLELEDIDCEPKAFGRFDANGRASVTCGGQLHVPIRSREGQYVGRVRLIVSYLN